MEFSIGHLSRSLDGVWDNYLFFSFRTYLKNDYFDQYEDSTQDPAKPDDEIQQLNSLEKEINY